MDVRIVEGVCLLYAVINKRREKGGCWSLQTDLLIVVLGQ